MFGTLDIQTAMRGFASADVHPITRDLDTLIDAAVEKHHDLLNELAKDD